MAELPPKDNEPKISLELTKLEANGLLDLLDIACRHGGLQAARLAVSIDDKIQQKAVELSNPPGNDASS